MEGIHEGGSVELNKSQFDRVDGQRVSDTI